MKMSPRNLNQIKCVLSQEPRQSISSLPINKDAKPEAIVVRIEVAKT